ncbi:DUF3147 family protein [Mucilaginibacter sp.]|uniref:DUF3147 family protein n=1 Tax=Mucilaginibacter sp. TaxID=1882438 RepID=UPI003AFFC944
MDHAILFKVILSMVIGGVWVLGSTVIVDKFGTKIGGLIAGLPSTVVVALYFIGLSQGTQTAVQSTVVIPLAFAVNGPFMLAYAYLSKRGLWQSILSALAVWFVLSYLIIAFHLHNFIVGLVICISVLIFSIIIFENKFSAISSLGQKTVYKKAQLFFRALFAGLIIGAAVFASHFLSPMIGGVLASFPAVFVSTLLILHNSQGSEIAVGLAKALLVSGFINVITYVIAVHYFYNILGINRGTLVALIISLFTAFLTHRFVLNKLK